MQSNALLRSDVGSTDKLMGNNNNLNNNGSPGAHIMFPMEDEGLTQLGSVFQSAYQSIVDGGPQVGDRGMVIRRNSVCLSESLRKSRTRDRCWHAARPDDFIDRSNQIESSSLSDEG